MKTLTALLAAFVLCSAAAAQNNSAPSATDQAAQPENVPAVAAAADPAPKNAGGNKICRMQHGWNCKLSDNSLEPGAHCSCHDHPGIVDIQ